MDSRSYSTEEFSEMMAYTKEALFNGMHIRDNTLYFAVLDPANPEKGIYINM